MKRVREEEGIKHVFIASGVRYDLAERAGVRGGAGQAPRGRSALGGPEHVSPRVLEKMKKPGIESYERFREMFACASKDAGKEQYDIPYFISGAPGLHAGGHDRAGAVAEGRGLPAQRQVQDFIPTPMSMASAMYLRGSIP
jgi:radical SAM superfamily enzyme YgiQ (UPF0313 family)